MKFKKVFLLLLFVAFLGITSCAQSLCPAYVKVDDNQDKKEKREGRF